MAQRRKQKTNGTPLNIMNGTINGSPVVSTTSMTRQDSRLSVKSLIESIENTSKQTKGGSRSGSTSSLNSLNTMEQEQDELMQSPSVTQPEKQQKTFNNNSITNNNNLSGSFGNIIGGQRNRGKSMQVALDDGAQKT